MIPVMHQVTAGGATSAASAASATSATSATSGGETVGIACASDPPILEDKIKASTNWDFMGFNLMGFNGIHGI